MSESQLNQFIYLLKNLHHQHPNAVKEFPSKLNKLNYLKTNKIYNWLEVKNLFEPTEFLTLISALSKHEGYTLIKKEDDLWVWNTDKNYKEQSISIKGLHSVNKGHPGFCVGVELDSNPQIITASYTKNPNLELSILCKDTRINQQFDVNQIKQLKLSTNPNAHQFWMNKISTWKGRRPEITSYLGEFGNEKLIFISYNYDIQTGLYTPQYISSVLYSQFLSDFITNPDFVLIHAEKPDELLKLGALYTILNNKSMFKIYNFKTNTFEQFDPKGKFLANWPYQKPNIYSIIYGQPPSYYHTKQQLENLNQSKNWIDWFKDNWPF